MVEPGVLPPDTVFWPLIKDGERTVVVALPLSLPGFPSGVVEVAVAVLVIVEPAATVGLTATTSVKMSLPTANDASEQFIVPVSPLSGVVQDQLPVDDKETKVVPAGSVSLNEALSAAPGPLLFTVIV